MSIARSAVVLAATAVAAAAVAAAPALAAGTTTINVSLKEFKVLPSKASAPAGKVTFKVKNVGALVHEMIVVKTNLAPAKLKKADGSADESASVGEVAELKAGTSGSVTLTLKPGKYVLLCNVPGHFAGGQYTAFTVK